LTPEGDLHERTSEKQFKNFSRERLQRNYSDKKSDLAYEQRGFISVSAFGFAACRGIESSCTL
jgi:hypothetical protein